MQKLRVRLGLTFLILLDSLMCLQSKGGSLR